MADCMMCGAPVEFSQFTALCNDCETANLDYANAEPVEIQVIPPAFTWSSQACQYAEHGPPGCSHEQHAIIGDQEVSVGDPDTEMLIDCLLMRDRHGALIGILNHYTGENEYEKTGNVNVWVRPDRQRRGIATALVREAQNRWNVDWRTQRYTEQGLALLKKLVGVAERNTPEATP
jgi:GNAT superfamily N-acetyltransferase